MNIAFGSLMELLNQVIISKDLGLINEDQYTNIRGSIELISNKLAALTNYFKTHNEITK
jgi:four helix bundle protein